ncbi:MAG: tetratricopeptide repeat protein [Bauldia sp.]
MKRMRLGLVALATLVSSAVTPAIAQEWQDWPGLAGRAYTGAAERDYLLGLKAYYQADYINAIYLWSRLGESADARSEAGLALLYYIGVGTQRDNDKAFYWASLAAERGQPEGQSLLGRMYLSGRGVKQDIIAAYAWCETAQMAGGFGGCRGEAIQQMTGPMLPVAFKASNDLQARFRPNPVEMALPPKGD